MSEKKSEAKAPTFLVTGAWQNAWKTAAGAGVVGVGASLVGAASDPKRFAFAWLFAFATCLAIALGALFFIIIQRLTSAHWSVTVRRTAEFLASGVVIFPVLFVPIVALMPQLFPWAAHHGDHGAAAGGHHGAVSGSVLEGTAHAEETETAKAPAAEHAHAAAAGDVAPTAAHGEGHAAVSPSTAPHGPVGAGHELHPGLPDPHEVAEEALMAQKGSYLNKSFFVGRAIFYMAVWVLLALRFFSLSTSQDKTKDPKLTLAAQSFAPIATFLFGITLTFAAVDWLMSLEPAWFSTIFGVYYFATAVVSSLATIIVVTLSLRDSQKGLAAVITAEHYHDLGKLMFGFLVFWAYIGFSQFMLIWYASLPEEVTWYHQRWDAGPWAAFSMLILVGHFVVPFFWLISRHFKRDLSRLRIGAAWLLLMHVVDIYWFVMPSFGQASFSVHWMDLTCLVGVTGLYLAVVFFRMTKYPLIPVGDPRLARSVAFQNA